MYTVHVSTIVAIGGGGIKQSRYTPKTLAIDQEIVKLSAKPKPRVLFVPTAHNDEESYSRSFHDYYTHYLGCPVDVLKLTASPLLHDMQLLVNAADIIYVGGGNTLKMIKIWRKTGFDRLLMQAAQTDKVLAGVSAGAICWFDAGISDSRRFTRHGRSWPYINVHGLDIVEGLGLHNLILCPHYDTEPRRHTALRRSLSLRGGTAVALEECTALVINNHSYRVLASDNSQNAYKAYWKGGKYYMEKLDKSAAWVPLTDLVDKQTVVPLEGFEPPASP